MLNFFGLSFVYTLKGLIPHSRSLFVNYVFFAFVYDLYVIGKYPVP